jgi:hypothetical protein
MGWRLAKSLQRLESEIESKYPGTTVWSIGDQSHQAGYSDHNPNGSDVVCAIDVKGDGGMSLKGFVDHLLEAPHANLRYVIYNRKIYQRKNAFRAQDYNGVNAHATHVHVSVGNGPDGRSTSGYDSTEPWHIDLGATPKPSTPAAPKPSKPTTKDPVEEAIMSLPTVKDNSAPTGAKKRAQSLLAAAGFAPVNTFDGRGRPDGKWGNGSKAALKSFQASQKLAVDGICGPKTWTELIKG